MVFMHVDLLRMKTADGASVWNPEERCTSALNNALCSAALFWVATETDREQELSKMKSTKALVERNPPEQTKQAHAKSVDPAIMKLRGLFDNCSFANKKVKTFSAITNEPVLQETKELNDAFPYLPETIETWKSANIFKKTEEERKFQETRFRSAMHTLQMEKKMDAIVHGSSSLSRKKLKK